MRTQDYLKQASDTLKQALAATQSDIDGIRHAIDQYDRERHTQMNELKQHEAEQLKDAADTDSDRENASKLYDARMLREEESKIENNFKKQKQELDNHIAILQRTLDELNQIIRRLDQQVTQLNFA